MENNELNSWKITECNANATSRFAGSRLRYWVGDKIIHELIIPAMYGGKNYVEKHPNGEYARLHYQYLADIIQKSKGY